jgi:hypothetical protein
MRVDFDHPELCTGSDPIVCVVEGISFSGKNWRDLLVALTEYFLSCKPQAKDLYFRSFYQNGECPFLLKEKSRLQARQISNGYWIYVNLSIKDLVITIGKLCQFCGVNLADVEITYVPKAIKGLKDVSMAHSSADNAAAFAQPIVPGSVLAVLRNDYTSGIRFDATALRLLSGKAGVEVDENMQTALKRQMFCRNDGVYFLLDHAADGETQREIAQFADFLLDEYGCFEVSELYGLYADRLNGKIIGSAEDFEKFYGQIGRSGVCCVQAPHIGNRIARYSNGNVWGAFEKIAAKIVSVIADEYYGSCNEDDLHSKFCAFSTELLGKIIKQCAAYKLIRVEINDSVCYQTFDALGLPDDFSEVLAEALERLSDIGLDPTQDALHTALSLKLGVNFMSEYNLPDWETFRRLISLFYKAEPRREWKSNIFGEVSS